MTHLLQTGKQRVGRRALLGAAASLAATATVARGQLLPSRVEQLLAEGVIEPETVMSKDPLVLPPDLVNALAAGWRVRGRVEYPQRRNLLTFKAFLAAPTDPPPPLTELPDNDPRIFVHLVCEILDTHVAMYREPAVALIGRVVAEIKMSPFFPNITGRIGYVCVGFAQEGTTDMELLEVAVAGDHAVFAREARGIIKLHQPSCRE